MIESSKPDAKERKRARLEGDALDKVRKLVLKDDYGKRADWQVICGLYPTILNQDLDGIGKTGTFMWLCKEHQQFVQTVQKYARASFSCAVCICVLSITLLLIVVDCSMVPFTPEFDAFESVKDKIAANIVSPVRSRSMPFASATES